MGLRFKYTREPDLVVPKTDDLDIETVSFPDITGYDSGNPLIIKDVEESTTTESALGNAALPSEWSDWTINIDLSEIQGFVEGVNKTLETIQNITDIFIVVLKILRILSSDLRNISKILKLILKVIIKQLKGIIEGLTSLGVYVNVINPDFGTSGKKLSLPINGGFSEYRSRVQRSLLNSADPGAPKFGSGDVVGGVFIASIAGVNDPDILSNLLYNFEIIMKFFGFKGFNVPAPKGLRAIPGFYDKDGEKVLGVKLTWTSDLEYVSGFEVTRNIGDGKGIFIQANNPEKTPIEIYTNEGFNGEDPVEVKQNTAKTKYSYIDFDVDDGETYYYKVYSYLGSSSTKFFDRNPVLRDVKSPVASNTVYATPRAKLPLSLLRERTLMDTKGNLVLPFDLAGEWKSISMKTFLGPALEKLFDKIDNIADLLDGAITIGSDAFGNYIKFLQKKIKKIIKVLDTIENIINIIAQFSFRGTMAVLKIAPEKGGMANLAQKFSDACAVPATVDKDKPLVTSGNPFEGANEKGIMFGVTLVYGYPQLDGDYVKKYFKPVSDLEDPIEDQIERSKKAMDTILGLLGLS
jgi:hypothetical protein